MNYKALRLKVDNHLYYKVVGYAERERRSINNSVEYILQWFFEEHPLEEDDHDDNRYQYDGRQEER